MLFQEIPVKHRRPDSTKLKHDFRSSKFFLYQQKSKRDKLTFSSQYANSSCVKPNYNQIIILALICVEAISGLTNAPPRPRTWAKYGRQSSAAGRLLVRHPTSTEFLPFIGQTAAAKPRHLSPSVHREAETSDSTLLSTGHHWLPVFCLSGRAPTSQLPLSRREFVVCCCCCCCSTIYWLRSEMFWCDSWQSSCQPEKTDNYMYWQQVVS